MQYRLLLMMIFCSLTTLVAAQTADSADSLVQKTEGYLEKLRAFGQRETKSSVEKFRNGRVAMRQDSLLQQIRITSEQARIFLRRGVDTIGFANDLDQVRNQLELIRQGIFVNTGSNQSTRNLAVSSAILNELLVRMYERRTVLAKNIRSVIGYVDHIDSLSADSALYTFPFDSVATAEYIRKVSVVARELGPVDTSLRKSATSLQQLATNLDLLVFEITSNYEDIESLRRRQVHNTFDQEFAYLWDKPNYQRSFREILTISCKKEILALKYYIHDYKGRALTMLLLIFASWYFLRSLRQKWIAEKQVLPQHDRQLVLRYPLLSAIILVICLFQFVFLQPPFIFSFGLWLIASVSLGIIFRGFIAGFWLRFWMIMVLFFVLGGLSNMILEASRTERWLMLLLPFSGVLYGLYVLRSRQRKDLKERGILYFIAFVVLMEFLSCIFNITGRYNLSKSLLISGFAGMVIAVLFLWTIRLINEGLGLISVIYKHPDRKLFYIDFSKVGERAPRLFYFFLVVGWFVLVGRNFYVFHQLTLPFEEWLNAERTVGNYTFSIYSLFIFVIIIAISAFLSQVISFFTTDPVDPRLRQKGVRKPGLGSWLLLIRIFILSVGIFFAFAAAGIPVDKLTIILGALGVGIGLGLQGLVSNLVSGLIIAFEKPVNVGDIIEINGKTGTMKSIGFRSSSVNLSDGGCLIIPNSDLLSHQLLNWTANNNKRQMNLVVRVAYNSDLKKVKELLENVFRSNEKVLTYPEPAVSVKAFEESAIAFDLYFWVGHLRDVLTARNEILTGIKDTFHEHGIVVPFPQQELHIISDLPNPRGDNKEQAT